MPASNYLDSIMYYNIISGYTRIGSLSICTINTRLDRLTNLSSLNYNPYLSYTSALIHSFPVRSMKSWNNLTDTIVHSANINSFKKKFCCVIIIIIIIIVIIIFIYYNN